MAMSRSQKGPRMLAYVAIPITCWLCALVAIPRKPRVGNEIAELVYVRLLGRQQRLLLLAAAVTAITLLTLVAMMPAKLDPERSRVIPVDHVCVDPQVGAAC